MKLRNYSFLAALILLPFLPTFIQSQGSGDAIHSVAGLIFTPERRPAGRGIAVRLSKGANDGIAWTDEDGRFMITGVSNGTYTLSVDPGEGLESVSHRFEITFPRGTPPQIVNVNIELNWKPGSRPKPGVIDSNLAGVPKTALQNYKNAGIAAAKGDYQGAVDELLKAVTEYPEFALAHTELGSHYQKLNQLEKSKDHLLIALKLKPESYEPLASLGVVLVRMGKYEEAESVLRKAIKIKDSSAVAHFYLGRSLLGQKKPENAVPEFRTALTMGGNDMIEARRSLANIYLQLGENELALTELEAYLSVNPKPADEIKLRETMRQITELLKETPKP